MQRDQARSELNIWLDLFPESSCQHVASGTTMFSVGDAVDRIFLIESGAVAELRHEQGSTHAICLCHLGMLVGVRWTGGPMSRHAVEAVTLGDSVLRSIPQDVFLRSTREDGRYTNMMLADMAKRVDSAQRLSDCLAQPSARDHILSVMHAIADECTLDECFHASISVPAPLLQRLTGCPYSTMGAAIHELLTIGLVQRNPDGLQLADVRR